MVSHALAGLRLLPVMQSVGNKERCSTRSTAFMHLGLENCDTHPVQCQLDDQMSTCLVRLPSQSVQVESCEHCPPTV